jgi:hypothetical protein
MNVATALKVVSSTAVKEAKKSSKCFAPIVGTIGVPMNLPTYLINVPQCEGDEGYQRPLNVRNAKNIAEKWDWDRYQPISVARRPDGSYWVFDGQTRHAAAVMRGDVLELPCYVTNHSTIASEARAFVGLNTDRTRVKAIVNFKAMGIGESPAHLALIDILNQFGVGVGDKPDAETTSAIGALVKHVSVKNPKNLPAALKDIVTTFAVCEAAWVGQEKAFSGRTIEGMLRLVTRVKGDARILERDAKKQLGRYDIEDLLKKADDLTKSSKQKNVIFHLPTVFMDHFNLHRRQQRLG